MDVEVGAAIDIGDIPLPSHGVRGPYGGGKYAAVYTKFDALPVGKAFPLKFPDAKLAKKAGAVLRQRVLKDGGIIVMRGQVIWVGRTKPAPLLKAVTAAPQAAEVIEG